MFSAPSDTPRIRLRTDLISAGLNSVVLVLLILVAGDGSTFDDSALQFVGTLPGWLLWIGQAAYVVGVVYSFALLVGVGVLAHDRLELLRDMALAALLAVVVVSPSPGSSMTAGPISRSSIYNRHGSRSRRSSSRPPPRSRPRRRHG